MVGGFPYFYKRKSMVHNIKDMVADYGPICGVYIGSKRLVVIADLDMLKGEIRGYIKMAKTGEFLGFFSGGYTQMLKTPCGLSLC